MKYLLLISIILFTGCNNSKTSITAEENLTEQPTTKENIHINISKTELNIDESTDIIITNNEVILEDVKWIITPNKAIIKDGILTAIDNGEVSIQAITKDSKSNIVKINIIWVVNGITLPEEPDKILNDSTLPGIDSNKNGVRDDIERWVYSYYKDQHPIHIDIYLQKSRTYQYLLEHPNMTYDEVIATKPFFDAPSDCKSYFKYYFKDKILINPLSTSGFRKLYFNTDERDKVYFNRDHLLSGGSYSLTKIELLLGKCDFNTSNYNRAIYD